MLYLYLDESGDLGFDFVNKNPSRYFTVAILVVRGKKENQLLLKTVKNIIKRKLNPKNKRKRIVSELKAAKTSEVTSTKVSKTVKILVFNSITSL